MLVWYILSYLFLYLQSLSTHLSLSYVSWSMYILLYLTHHCVSYIQHWKWMWIHRIWDLILQVDAVSICTILISFIIDEICTVYFYWDNRFCLSYQWSEYILIQGKISVFFIFLWKYDRKRIQQIVNWKWFLCNCTHKSLKIFGLSLNTKTFMWLGIKELQVISLGCPWAVHLKLFRWQ